MSNSMASETVERWNDCLIAYDFFDEVAHVCWEACKNMAKAYQDLGIPENKVETDRIIFSDGTYILQDGFLVSSHYPSVLQDTLTFGKHKGKSVEHVLKNENKYVSWILETFKNGNAWNKQWHKTFSMGKKELERS